MSYIILTGVSAIFLALYDFFKKISVKDKESVFDILFFYTFISFLCSTIFVKDAFSIEHKYILFTLLKSVIISLSWFFTMKAMSKLDLGIVTPFSMLGTVFVIILAFIFFGDKIGLIQIGGSLVILIGLLLLSKLNKKDEDSKRDLRYLWLLVLAAFLSSISAIIDKHLLNNVSNKAVLFWFFLFLSIIYLIVCLIKNKRIVFKNLISNLWVVLVGISISLADMFYYKALEVDNSSVSIISIVRKLSVFIGVVLASVFLKEGKLVKKLLIFILMVIGLGGILFW